MRPPLVEAALVHELAGGIPGQRVLWLIRRAPDPKCAWLRLAWVNYVNSKMYAARLAECFSRNKY
jgi:hypothetical protein